MSTSDLADKLAGTFLVIDGPDGAGKSTQLGRLRDYLCSHGLEVESVVDPGTTNIGKKIRALLLDRDNGEIGPMCETLLFMAARAQLVHECVLPAVERGKTVLCDRFISATIAYQGASGVDREQILELGRVAIGNHWPDLTVILDLPAAVGMKRLGVVRKRLKKDSGEASTQLPLFGDRMESRTSEYHRVVRETFRTVHRDYPGKVAYVRAVGTQDEVFDRILEAVQSELGT